MIRKLRTNKYLIVSLVCLVTGLLSIQGCKKAEQDSSSNPAVAPVASAAVGHPAKPAQKQMSSSLNPDAATVNQFDFSTKKDPFKPYVLFKKPLAVSSKSLKRSDRFLLPIHSFDVSQFRVIGVITGGKENQAMVVDPNGKGYVLKVGMTIGKNDGRIVSISAGGVDVLEQFRDDNGKLRKEHIKISMPRKL